MDAAAFLQRLSDDDVTRDRLVHIETLPARAPETALFPGLPDPIPDRLRLLEIEGLYPHQARALDLLEHDRNVIVASGTASGKTLVYDLAFARAALEDPKSTALFLFPTKALARDQVRQIRSLRLPQIRAAVYDGDTPGPERPLIRRTANLILTNPDMLHAGILPGHARWADFFLRLSLIVVDEAHVCRGVFGSHVALVLRRLRRLVAHYGGNPPLLDDESGTRGSAITEASFLLSRLVDDDVRAIAFARSRRAAEILADATRRSLNPALAGRVKAYRAGYLPEERRALERALADGDLLAVASTSALELGIDIGSLDAAILTGYPGTRASMWQQAGRAGRRSAGSLAVLVAQDDPLDQYLVTHPADLFSKPAEAAVVDPTNPYILGPHLSCAAREQPLAPEEFSFFGDAAPETVEKLTEEGKLVERRGLVHHRGEDPHRRVDIRSASGHLVLIVDADTGAVLGTVDESRAFHQVHPGALYLHQGEQYEVAELDLDRWVALVRPSDADWWTQARDVTDIEVLDVLAESKVGATPMFFGDVRVTTQVVGFQRKMHLTGEVLDERPLDLPPQTLETRSVWWAVPDQVIARARVTPPALPGAAHAAEHAAIGLLPLVATCDRWDVGGVSTALHPDTASCAIFIYDGYPGGAGICERGFAAGGRLLHATLEAIRACPCQSGCPSCVQSPKCGNGNEPLDKHRGADLLEAILG